MMYTIVPKPVTGPADNEIWYTSNDNNKLIWWALDYVPTEQIATLGGDNYGENVFYTPGDSGYERIYGYDVLYHEYDKDKECFVLKFDKPLTETFWKFGHPIGGDGEGVACGRNITSFILPNSVNYIMEYTFYCCDRLASINIPNSVTSIGENVFYGCSSLPIENNLRYADTYLVEAVGDTLPTYSIREGTNWIGQFAFSNRSLTSITIPNGVTRIGDGAFWACYKLTSITISNSVTIIGDGAFAYCTGLTSITFKGTMEQWNAIAKGGYWNVDTPATYVQCSDGQVAL